MRVRAIFDEKKIDAVFAGFDRCREPGVAVGIAIDGATVYRKGFGLASLELPVVLSPAIRMRIASLTKQFTSLAYLLLCEGGRSGIDDPVEKHLPELHRVSHGVTMRQLIGHVGGLRDVHDLRHHLSGTSRRTTAAELFALYRQIDSINFEPGRAWCYNNGGYLMLSLAIERIADRSLEDVLRESLFAPLGMHDTLLRRWDSDFVANSATLHMTNPAGGYEKTYINKEHLGEGGVVSTIDDMLRWLAHMNAPSVGSGTTWDLVKTPLTLRNGASTGYGLGLTVDHYRGVETLSHSGGLMGCHSRMLKVPAAGLDVVVLANRHDVMVVPLVNQIVDSCLTTLDPVPQEPERDPVIGLFRSRASGRVIQLLAREREQIISVDGSDLPVLVQRDRVLQVSARQCLTLQGDAQRPSSVRFMDAGCVDEYVAIDAACDARGARIAGQYRSDAIDATLTIAPDSSGLDATGPFGSTSYFLEYLGAGIWRARSKELVPWGAILTLDENAAVLRFATARTRSVIFRRVM